MRLLALERHAAPVRQLLSGTNDDTLVIQTQSKGRDTIQTVHYPMHTKMSAPGSTAKVGTAQSNKETAQSCFVPLWLRLNPQCIGQHTR